MNKKKKKQGGVDAVKIFQTIEDHKHKLLSDDDMTEDEFQDGLELLMGEIMDGIEGKKKGDKNEKG